MIQHSGQAYDKETLKSSVSLRDFTISVPGSCTTTSNYGTNNAYPPPTCAERTPSLNSMDIIFLDFGTDEGDNASSNNNAQNRLYFVYLSVYLWNSEIRGTVKDGSLNTLYKRKKVPFLSHWFSSPSDRISGTRLKGILNQ